MKVFLSLLSLLVLAVVEQSQIYQLLSRVMTNPLVPSVAIVFLVFFVGIFGSKYTDSFQKALILLGFSALLFLSYWNQVNISIANFEQNKQKSTSVRVGKIDKIREKIDNLQPKIKCFYPTDRDRLPSFWVCKKEQNAELARIEKDTLKYESRINELQKEIIDISDAEIDFEDIIVKACIGIIISIIFTGVFRVATSILFDYIDSMELLSVRAQQECDYFDTLSLERKIQILKQEGKTPKQISEELDVPQSTVYYKLKRMV
jgi:hypothetical protein